MSRTYFGVANDVWERAGIAQAEAYYSADDPFNHEQALIAALEVLAPSLADGALAEGVREIERIQSVLDPRLSDLELRGFRAGARCAAAALRDLMQASEEAAS